MHEKLYPTLQFTLRKKGSIEQLISALHCRIPYLMQCALLYTAHILANVDDLNFQWTWTFRYAYCFLLKLVASMRFETDAVVLWEIQNPAVLIQTLIWLISGCTETQLLFWQFFSQHWVVHSVLSLTKKKNQTAFSSPWVWSEISASLTTGPDHTHRRRPIDGWWMRTLTFDSSDVRAAGE